MKIKAVYITCCIIILFTGSLSAQENGAENNAIKVKMEYSPINVPVDIQNYLDQVFPGVIFQYGRNLYIRGEGSGKLTAVYKNDRYEMPGGFNSLLDSLNVLNSQKIRIPDETLIKGYAYLTLLSQYFSREINFNNMYKIIVSKDSLQYPKYDNKGILQEPATLDYTVIVDFFGPIGENYWKHAELHYRIQSKEIQYDYGFIELNTRVRQKINN